MTSVGRIPGPTSMQYPALSDWREAGRTPEVRHGCRSGVVAIPPENAPASSTPILGGMGALRRSRNRAHAAKHNYIRRIHAYAQA
jgi:hypothetical protein